MRKKSTKKKIFLVIVFMLIVLMFLSIRKEIKFSFLSGTINTVLLPFQVTGSYFSKGIRNTSSYIYNLYNLNNQNTKLIKENELLKQSLTDIAEVRAENDRLRLALDYKQRNVQMDMILANIIAYTPSDYLRYMIIDKGILQNIAVNMVVVTSAGLVGNVVEVYPASSKIQLITSVESAVGAMVQRSELRDRGVVEGMGEKNLRMINLPREANLIKGDKIVTSGLGGIYPKGLLIGEVIEIKNETGFLKKVILTPSVDFDSLEEVFVIRGYKK